MQRRTQSAAGVAGDESNVAYRKTARQFGTYISAALSAVDGDNTTASCTDSVSHPWWSVDLGHHYLVRTVIVTSPDVSGSSRNYRLHLASFMQHRIGPVSK